MTNDVNHAAALLDEAKAAVTGPRRESYGGVEVHFNRVAAMWNIYLERDEYTMIKASDVPIMMVLYKLVREMESHSHDNLVDVAGYAAVAEEYHAAQG